MHSPSRSRHGHPLSSQIRYGKDRCLRPCHSSAAGTDRQPSLRSGHVPHSRTRFPDQQGIRALQQVHVGSQSLRVFRRNADPERRRELENIDTAHRRRNSRPRSRSHPQQEVELEALETFHPR